MLRRDGKFVIFMIQHQRKNGSWSHSNYDHFGTPHPEFSASGDCWQQTGIHGTYNEPVAELALIIMGECNPGIKFRLVECTFEQQTVDTGAEFKARGPEFNRGFAEDGPWRDHRKKVFARHKVKQP